MTQVVHIFLQSNKTLKTEHKGLFPHRFRISGHHHPPLGWYMYINQHIILPYAVKENIHTQKHNLWKESMMLDWNFQRGWGRGFKLKKPLWGGVWISSGTTQHLRFLDCFYKSAFYVCTCACKDFDKLQQGRTHYLAHPSKWYLIRAHYPIFKLINPRSCLPY